MQKQTTLTKWQNYNIFCRCYLVVLGAQVGSFLDVLFLLLATVLSEPHEKPRRNNDRVMEKMDSLFLTARHPFHIIFCCSLCLLPTPSQATYLLNCPYIDTLFKLVFCVMISLVNGKKYENLFQFNTSWLVFLRK